MNAGDLLAVIEDGVFESDACDSLRGGLCADFEGLDDSGHSLVGHGRVLPLRILADNDDIDVLVAGRERVEGLGVDNVGIKVQFVAEIEFRITGGAVTTYRHF